MANDMNSSFDEADAEPGKSGALVTVHGWNFRGFKRIEVPLNKTIFLVGDNSSGKSSILHLVSCILKNDLELIPSLDDNLSVGRYDYFSPYLENKDVTLAYDYKSAGKRVGRMVTVRRVPNKPPIVLQSSYFANGNVVTMKRRGGTLVSRLSEISATCSFDELFDLHSSMTGFKKRRSSRLEGIAPNDLMSVFTAFGQEQMEELGVFDIVTSSLPMVRHIAPVRGLPERFYDLKRTLTSSGKHFAVMWRDLESKKAKLGFEDVESFGRESSLFQAIEVERLSRKFDDAPLIVHVKKNGRRFFLNQMGVGVSQVVPILVESIFARSSSNDFSLLFQQPELHLHPVAQAALGTFFFNFLHRKVPLIIETHSSFLIDRFRSELRDESTDTNPDVSIFFCQNTEGGNECSVIEVDANGKLVGAPAEYFSFFVSEMQRTFF